MEALTPARLSHARRGIPDSRHMSFRPFWLQTPDDPSRSLSHAHSAPRASFRTVSPLRPPRPGFAIGPQARQIIRSNRVPYRADRSFAFRCSPPRLRATQLRSAMVNERLTRRDSHSSAHVRFRAHGPALKRLVHVQLARRHGGRRSRILQPAAAAVPLRLRQLRAARG